MSFLIKCGSIPALLATLITCSENGGGINPVVQSTHGTSIEGSISGYLTKDDSPYYVINDIYIDSLNTLEIEPGVRLIFYDSTNFTIRGTLLSVGDTLAFITYTSFSGSWFGINIENSLNENRFQFSHFDDILIEDSEISEFGAITIYNSNASIINCVIRDNSTVNGGGIAIIESEVVIKNNIIRNNQAAAFGGGIISIESVSKIYNNTIFQNRSSNYGGGLVLINPVQDDIQNNIFYLNSNQSGDPGISINSGDSTKAIIHYNFYGNSNLDPRFVSDDNLELQIHSPCIDNGNPEINFNDNNGTRNDQGSFGGPNAAWWRVLAADNLD